MTTTRDDNTRPAGLHEAATGPRHSARDCTIDLRGAGFDCLYRDDKGVRIGYIGEGDKVMLGVNVCLDGLHILGPVALAEMLDKARAEKAEAALAAGEPVAWMHRWEDGNPAGIYEHKSRCVPQGVIITPLYAHPTPAPLPADVLRQAKNAAASAFSDMIYNPQADEEYHDYMRISDWLHAGGSNATLNDLRSWVDDIVAAALAAVQPYVEG